MEGESSDLIPVEKVLLVRERRTRLVVGRLAEWPSRGVRETERVVDDQRHRWAR
jgi:hypothetical protein